MIGALPSREGAMRLFSKTIRVARLRWPVQRFLSVLILSNLLGIAALVAVDFLFPLILRPVLLLLVVSFVLSLSLLVLTLTLRAARLWSPVDRFLYLSVLLVSFLGTVAFVTVGFQSLISRPLLL